MSKKRKGYIQVPGHGEFMAEAFARKKFGLTGNLLEAGYILADGNMLDFSGKREGGSAGVRALDHREVAREEVYYGAMSRLMQMFCAFHGALRVIMIGRNIGLDAYARITPAQTRVVCGWAEILNSDVFLSINAYDRKRDSFKEVELIETKHGSFGLRERIEAANNRWPEAKCAI